MFETELLLLCIAAFAAGFVDSIVGGGGLLQLPAFLMILPQHPVVNLLATNKLVSIAGTSFAAWRFSRTIQFDLKIALWAVGSAFVAAMMGAYTVSIVSNEFLKPLCFVILIAVFFLTIRNQKFGIVTETDESKATALKGALIAAVVGFYDGFFGPGTGVFLILAFVGLMNYSFVKSSAYSKIINTSTNAASIVLFAFHAEFLYHYAIPMMICNTLGSMFGVRLALLKGNQFVRALLRLVVLGSILKLGWDLFKPV